MPLESIIAKDGAKMADICFYLTHYAVSKTYKFFFLADKLRELGITVEIVLCSTEQSGILPNEINASLLEKFKLWKVSIKSRSEMIEYVQKNKWTYFVVGCYSGDLSPVLKLVRKNGSKIIEISTIGFNDPIEHQADINLLISELAFKAALHKRPKRAKLAKNIHFVGSLFSDDIPNTYTSNITSVDSFKKKYQVNKTFVWMPGRDDLSDLDFQKRLVNVFPKFDLVMTTHPWSEKYQNKELKRVKSFIKHIDSNDVYWAFKSMEGGIARNSTSGIEISVMKKPMIYVEKQTRRPFLGKHVTPVGFFCKSLNDIGDYLDCHVDESVYEKFLNTIYPSPYRESWKRICDFFSETMCIKTKK